MYPILMFKFYILIFNRFFYSVTVGICIPIFLGGIALTESYRSISKNYVGTILVSSSTLFQIFMHRCKSGCLRRTNESSHQ